MTSNEDADILEWQAMAEGAYSANTLRAQKADGAIFQTFCESLGEPHLPADPKTIRAFIDDRVKAGKKPATVRRYVATLARAHIAAGLLNPCSSEAVRLGLKQMGRETSGRQDQAHPLGWKEIKDFIDSAGESLRADRERAMLCVAYETLARRGELVAFRSPRHRFPSEWARDKRSFGAGRRTRRGRGGWRIYHERP